jgi:hypothetical protein
VRSHLDSWFVAQEIDNLYNPDEIAVILRQLKNEVRSRHTRDRMDHSTAVAAALAQVEATSWVNPHQPIAWPHWPKGVWPKMVALAQKVIRRLMRWYINPIVEEQNQFNAAVAAALIVLAEENTRLRADLRALATNTPDRVLD